MKIDPPPSVADVEAILEELEKALRSAVGQPDQGQPEPASGASDPHRSPPA